MRGLRAISAIFAASARLDAEQTAALHLLAAPMLEMHRPAVRNQIEKRLMIQRIEFCKLHRNNAMFNRQSKIGNRKLIHPLAALGNEDWQFLHHELSFADCANHMGTGGTVRFLGHALTGMTTPTLDIGATREIPPVNLGQLAFVQPRFAGAIDVAAVIEHETSSV